MANRGQNGRAVEVNVPCCRDISTKVCVIKSSSPPSSSVHQSMVDSTEQKAFMAPGGMSTIQFSSVNHLETVYCTLQRLSSKKHTWQVLWLSLGLRHPVPLPVPWFGAKTCPLSSLPPPLPPPRLALPARLLSLEPHSTSPGMKGPTKRRVQRFEQINTTGFLWFWYFISPLLTCFGWWHPKLNSRCYRRRFILQSNI